jgi:hypothetical protein
VLIREKVPLVFTGLSLLGILFGDFSAALNCAFFWGGIFLIEQFRDYNKLHIKYIKWLGFTIALVAAQQVPDFWKWIAQAIVLALALRWQVRVRQYKV